MLKCCIDIPNNPLWTTTDIKKKQLQRSLLQTKTVTVVYLRRISLIYIKISEELILQQLMLGKFVTNLDLFSYTRAWMGLNIVQDQIHTHVVNASQYRDKNNM